MDGGWKKESERAGDMWDDDSLSLLASGTTCDKGIDKRGEAQHQKSGLTMALVWKRPACPVVGDPWREENKREAC